MGFFSKKPKIDVNAKFKDLYKKVNQYTMQANQELDFEVKESLLSLVLETYEELIHLIDEGAQYDKQHFLSLKENAQEEYLKIKAINQDEN